MSSKRWEDHFAGSRYCQPVLVIGIDGTNATLNSGRILINLKPLDERKISASDVIRRLQPELAASGNHLYMQPVQDISVEDRVSRTQFQYTWKIPTSTSWILTPPHGQKTARGS